MNPKGSIKPSFFNIIRPIHATSPTNYLLKRRANGQFGSKQAGLKANITSIRVFPIFNCVQLPRLIEPDYDEQYLFLIFLDS